MKKIIILFLAALLAPSLVLGGVNPLGIPNYGGPEKPDFRIDLLKYDPYPAEPGEYMTLWLEIYNTGVNNAEDVTFELEPEYPFSLDASETAIREFSEIPGLYTIVLQYKIRVDKDAIEGWNEIKLRYKIGDSDWIEEKAEVYVSEPEKKAELKAFYVSSNPKAFPGGETTLSVDLANIASGTAYYTYVEVESDIAEIEVNKVFIGTMDPDDFDTIDFDLKIKESVAPGRHPVTIKSYYKDEDDKSYETEDTVYMEVYTKEEVLEELEEKTPWWYNLIYVVYIIVALIVIRYFIIPPVKKLISFFKKKK